MLSDPLSVTYDGTAKTLPRTSGGPDRSVYRTGDSELELLIEIGKLRNGNAGKFISLSRKLPDPTPSNVFDDYRDVRNTFGVFYGFDVSRANLSVDIPLLRTALLAFVDTALQNRILAGER
jgi:hypothetical protein